MYFQSACFGECIITLIALVVFYLHVREDAKSHWLHLFVFSQLLALNVPNNCLYHCKFVKCALKLLAWKDATPQKQSYMHNFTPFLEKKSEIWNAFTLFDKWKVKQNFLSLILRMTSEMNALTSRSRMKSEMRMPQDRDQEVKFPKKSRKFSRNNTLAGYCWIQTIIHTEDTRNRFCHASLSHKYSSLYWIQTIIHIENTLKQFRHPFLSHWEG